MARRVSVLTAVLAALVLVPTAPARAVGPDGHEGSVFVVSGDVVIHRGETAGSVFIVHGDARIAGRVNGDVTVLSGDVLVSGTIDGDLFTASGLARLRSSAEVTGDVSYGDTHPDVAGSARVRGDVKREGLPDLDVALAWALGIVVWLAVGISAAALGCLLLLIAPGAAAALEATSRGRVGPLIAIGIAALIVLPVGAGIAAITFVGLPLAFVALLAALPIFVVAYLGSAWALGRRVIKPQRNRYLAFLAGLAILRLLELIPIVGPLFDLAAVIFGLGLLCAAIGAARKTEGPEPTQTLGS